MVTDSTPHYHGHRQRLRERLCKHPQDLTEYELLELILAYALPRKDTKPMAKELIARFGSLAGALQANACRITEIHGLGESTATLWTLWQECQARCASGVMQRREKFTSPEQVGALVCARLGHLTKEEFWVIFVDSQNRLLSFEHVFSGTVNQTAAYPREILERALRHHASGLILVHNHPGGDPAPSHQDKQLTKTIDRLATDLGLRLLDHLIVTGSTFSSFKELGEL